MFKHARLSRADVPDASGAIIGARDEKGAIWAEFDAIDTVDVVRDDA